MIAPADHTVLSPDLYTIAYGQMLIRKRQNGLPVGGVKSVGDVESFNLNITTNRIQRYRKNARTRTKAFDRANQIDSTISFQPMQWTAWVRELALLGIPVAAAQAAGVGIAFEATGIEDGDYVWTGRYDISNVAIVGLQAADFRIADAALGVVEIINAPVDGIIDGTTDCAAIAERQRIEIARQAQIDIEVMVRALEEGSPKGVLHLHWCQVGPNGDIPFIGSDEPVGPTIQGSAIDTPQGIGYWQPLSA